MLTLNNLQFVSIVFISVISTSKKFGKEMASSGKIGHDNWSISKSQKRTEQGLQKDKCSLLACHIHCKCFIEFTHNLVNVKIGIKVIQLVKCSDQLGSHCNWPSFRMSDNIQIHVI